MYQEDLLYCQAVHYRRARLRRSLAYRCIKFTVSSATRRSSTERESAGLKETMRLLSSIRTSTRLPLRSPSFLADSFGMVTARELPTVMTFCAIAGFLSV